MITQEDISSLCTAAGFAGFAVDPQQLELIRWEAGEGHVPTALPAERAAVYIFFWNDACLKVGKVNARSGARYQSHHYLPNSSRSNLAQSLLTCGHKEFEGFFNSDNIGPWIKSNTTRFNILIPSHFSKDFVHFTEAFFILKFSPKFEETRT